MKKKPRVISPDAILYSPLMTYSDIHLSEDDYNFKNKDTIDPFIYDITGSVDEDSSPDSCCQRNFLLGEASREVLSS